MKIIFTYHLGLVLRKLFRLGSMDLIFLIPMGFRVIRRNFFRRFLIKFWLEKLILFDKCLLLQVVDFFIRFFRLCIYLLNYSWGLLFLEVLKLFIFSFNQRDYFTTHNNFCFWKSICKKLLNCDLWLVSTKIW